MVVPLGTFGSRQEKTALMRVRVPAESLGVESVASLSLRYRDLASRSDEAISGALSLVVTPPADAQRDVDPFVAARLERSRTARTLTDANVLFQQGRAEEARRSLTSHARELAKTSDDRAQDRALRSDPEAGERTASREGLRGAARRHRDGPVEVRLPPRRARPVRPVPRRLLGGKRRAGERRTAGLARGEGGRAGESERGGGAGTLTIALQERIRTLTTRRLSPQRRPLSPGETPLLWR